MKIYITNGKQIFEIDKSVLSDVSTAYLILKGFFMLNEPQYDIYRNILSEKLNIENPQFIIDVDYNPDIKLLKFLKKEKDAFDNLLNIINNLLYQIRQDKLNIII